VEALTERAAPRPRPFLPLVLLLALGALALRVYDLAGESVWLDEGYSIRMARLSLRGIFLSTQNDIHPPLYYLLLHFWMRWFGDSEAAVRSMSVVAGTLGVIALARLGRRLFDPAVGLVAALLLALSTMHVHYSQEARAYAFNVLWGMLSLLAFLAFMREGGARRGFAWLLATLVMVYTHSFGWFAVIAENLYALLPFFAPLRPRGPGAARWLALQFALVALFVPWLEVLRHQVHTVQTSFYAGAPTFLTLGGTFFGYAGSPLLLALSGLALATWGVRRAGGGEEAASRAPDAPPEIQAVWLLVVWLAMLVIAPFTISVLWFPTYIRRATMVGLPAWYLLVAAALVRGLPRRARVIALAVFVALCAFELGAYYREANKERWREVVHEIESHAVPGDLVLFNQWYSKRDAYDYYARRTDLVTLPFPEMGRDWGSDPEARLAALTRDRASVWVVLSHTSDRTGLIVRTLGRSHHLVWHRGYVSRALDRWRERDAVMIDVYHFEKAGRGGG